MTPRARASRTGRRARAFTLIELLTVIGIIAVLAALLFPVFATVREKNRQAQCMTNMHHILQGINMFRDDNQGRYPEALFGLDKGAGFQTVLYPDFVKDTTSFVCPNAAVKYKAPPYTTVTATNPTPGATPYTFKLAEFSSYDFQYRPNSPTAAMHEVHYTRDWQGKGAALGADQRQLVFKNPGGDTVVTWCLYHTNMNAAGAPANNTMALVAFLNGNVKAIPASKFSGWPGTDGKCPWQETP